jgi:hypothetical protein
MKYRKIDDPGLWSRQLVQLWIHTKKAQDLPAPLSFSPRNDEDYIVGNE